MHLSAPTQCNEFNATISLYALIILISVIAESNAS